MAFWFARVSRVGSCSSVSEVAHGMWVCSTAFFFPTRCTPKWMKKAVGSTTCLPSTTLPPESTTIRSPGVISDQCSPCGLIRNLSGSPGTSRLKWLHTPSLSPMRAALRSAAVRSMRAWRRSYWRVAGCLVAMRRMSLMSMRLSSKDLPRVPGARILAKGETGCLVYWTRASPRGRGGVGMGWICSYARQARSTVTSAWRAPTSCIATGSPLAANPHGKVAAGCCVRLNG